jgi:hypothetical protein
MKKKTLTIIVIVVVALAIIAKAELTFNPSARLLASIINFSESTLNNPDYLAYNIDLKDLFINYTNADIEYSGNAYIKKLEGFPYSINGTIKGQRSTNQKKFSCKSDLDVLVMDVGSVDFYAKDQTVYLSAPILGGLAYGFDTNSNLFLEAPDLTNDINHEWFHNNKKNIFNFVRNIDIKKTDVVYVDEDGTKCDELKITIPQGEGKFIWDLLGMDIPDHDINCSVFLDKHNHTRNITFDLSYKTKGAYISISGKNFSTIELLSPLPDNEKVVATIKRNGENNYTNSFVNNITYTTNLGKKYSMDFNMLMNFVDDGIKFEATDVTIKNDDLVLAQGYVNGRVATVENMGDVFENAGVDLSDVEVIDWDTIKNDTASFIDDAISQARENVDIFNIFD